MQNRFNFIIKEKIDLPSTYNETKIVVVPRDVNVFFMYWEISDTTRKNLCNKGITCDFFIRVRNLNFDKYFSVFHPDSFTKAWYFDVSYTELSRNSIISDIGVYDNFGKFLILTSSNVISLPNKFYYGKDYYYWQRKKCKSKDNRDKSIENSSKKTDIFCMQNISSREFYNSTIYIKSIKR